MSESDPQPLVFVRPSQCEFGALYLLQFVARYLWLFEVVSSLNMLHDLADAPAFFGRWVRTNVEDAFSLFSSLAQIAVQKWKSMPFVKNVSLLSIFASYSSWNWATRRRDSLHVLLSLSHSFRWKPSGQASHQRYLHPSLPNNSHPRSHHHLPSSSLRRSIPPRPPLFPLFLPRQRFDTR